MVSGPQPHSPSLNIVQPVEQCKCNGPRPDERTFFCPYHQCTKTQGWYELCKTREDYRVIWNQNRGPGQITPKTKVTNPRVSRVSRPATSSHYSEPRDNDTIAYIREVLCLGCKHYRAETESCRCGTCKRDLQVARLIEHGNCPAYNW